MKTNHRNLVLAISASTLFTAYSPISFAQMALEEIIVTARKREESAQDIPVAVTAVTGEMFARANVENFEEASALAPGFTLAGHSFSPLVATLSMRGSAQNSIVPATDHSVGVYVDGVYIARTYGIAVDLVDLSDVQIVKGPQGTLFGRNSTAGAVLLTTNTPDLGEFSGSVAGSLGDIQTKGSVILNVPLGDMIALRVAHQQSDKDDYIKNIAQDPNNSLYTQFDTPTRVYDEDCSDGFACAVKRYDSRIGGSENELTRIKFRFAPNDDFDAVLSHEKFMIDLAGPARETTWLAGTIVNPKNDDDTVSLTFDPRSYAETDTTILTLNYSADFGDFKFTGGHREYRSLNENDYDGGDLASSHFRGTSVRRHGSWARSGGEQTTYELQFNTSFLNEKIDLTTGVNYFEEEASYYDYANGLDIYTYGFTGAGNGVQIDDSAVGVYAQATYHFTDRSNLTLGIRRTNDDKSAIVWGESSQVATTQAPTWDFDAYFNSPLYYQRATGDREGLTILRPQEEFSATDWLVSYDHKLTETFLVYGKVSTGFRAGGFNPRGTSDPTVSFVFEPEEIIEYEVGFKSDLLEDKLRWNTAVYFNETSDKQFSVLTASGAGGPPGTSTRNAGRAEAKGFETEVTYLFGESWSFSASYAYIHSEIKELESFNPQTGQVERVGKAFIPPPERVPESEWTLSVNYDKDFEGFKIYGTAMYHWIDEIASRTKSAADYYNDVSNFGLTLEDVHEFIKYSSSEAYGLLNVNLTASSLDDTYAVTLWSKNLLDERARQTMGGNLSGGSYQYAGAVWTEPRSYGVTIKYSF